jgi:purine-binding chemotaxis protein CheW
MTTAIEEHPAHAGAGPAGEARQLVAFALGHEEFGVPITRVQEIIRHTKPRPMPGSPTHVEGVINLRGRIIPVVDLRARLCAPGERLEDSKIVIVELASATVGIEVDEVREVLTVQAEDCEPAPQGTSSVSGDAIDSVAKLGGRLLVILDLDNLLGPTGME